MRTSMILGLGLILLAAVCQAETGVGDSPLFTLNTDQLTAVQTDGQVPAMTGVEACYPNPFNPRTTLRFSLAHDARVDLAVYDLKGRLVRHLVRGEHLQAGRYDQDWTGRDDQGRSVAGGLYLFRLKVGNAVFHHRVTLVK